MTSARTQEEKPFTSRYSYRSSTFPSVSRSHLSRLPRSCPRARRPSRGRTSSSCGSRPRRLSRHSRRAPCSRNRRGGSSTGSHQSPVMRAPHAHIAIRTHIHAHISYTQSTPEHDGGPHLVLRRLDVVLKVRELVLRRVDHGEREHTGEGGRGSEEAQVVEREGGAASTERERGTSKTRAAEPFWLVLLCGEKDFGIKRADEKFALSANLFTVQTWCALA